MPGKQLGRLLRADQQSAASDERAERVQQHISDLVDEFGPSWLNVESAVEHEYVRFEPRVRSTLAVIDVSADSATRRLVVKVASPAQDRPSESRVRIVPKTLPSERLQGESVALNKLYESVPDNRFFAIEPLALSVEPTILVMEWSPHPNLGHWLGSGPNEDAIMRVFHRAGAWLRSFHGLAVDEEIAYSDREAVASMIGKFTAPEHASRFNTTFRSLGALAIERTRALPNELTLGLLHGDMAPRNLLIDDVDRVGGIDVAARWRVPILHDIAAFLLAVRISRWRLDPRIHATNIDSWEQAFLDGYGLDGHQRRHLSVFSALLLVDRASAATGSLRRIA